MASVDLQQYPKRLKLTNGKEFTIRLMQPNEADKSAILQFAGKLNENDLLYLRTDITDPAVGSKSRFRERCCQSDRRGRRRGGGHASVHREEARWTRCVGEPGVTRDSAFAGRVSAALAAEAFTIGQPLGLRKLTAC